MATPRDEQQADPAATPQDSPGRIAAELQELGRQLASTARTAWHSEKRQEVQQEVGDGLRSLRDQVTEALDAVRADPRTSTVTKAVREQVDKVTETVKSDSRAQSVTQAVKDQAGRVVETVRGIDAVDELRTGLATGLRELNEQLRRLADRLAEQTTGEPPHATRDAASPPTDPPNVGTPVVTDVRDSVPVATPRFSGVAPESPDAGHIGGGVRSDETASGPPASSDGLPRGPESGGAQ